MQCATCAALPAVAAAEVALRPLLIVISVVHALSDTQPEIATRLQSSPEDDQSFKPNSILENFT